MLESEGPDGENDYNSWLYDEERPGFIGPHKDPDFRYFPGAREMLDFWSGWRPFRDEMKRLEEGHNRWIREEVTGVIEPDRPAADGGEGEAAPEEDQPGEEAAAEDGQLGGEGVAQEGQPDKAPEEAPGPAIEEPAAEEEKPGPSGPQQRTSLEKQAASPPDREQPKMANPMDLQKINLVQGSRNKQPKKTSLDPLESRQVEGRVTILVGIFWLICWIFK